MGKQGMASRRFLQPPALPSFDLLSSMSSQDRQQKVKERIEVLSNVQEKSYFSCEQSDIKPPDCRQLIATTRQRQEQLPTHSRKTLRIEDQAIIVVEEEADLASNQGEQSVILEQIDFKSETQLHENTPNWQHDTQERLKESLAEYAQGTPQRMARQCDYPSDSLINADFSYSEIRGPNRTSKNTCIDRVERTELLDFENALRQTNRSCIANPTGNSRDLRDELSIDKPRRGVQDRFYQVRNLLQYGQKCMQGELKVDSYAQTELSGNQLLQKQVYLKEQIALLQSKIKDLHEQNAKCRQAGAQSNQLVGAAQGMKNNDRMTEQMRQQRQARRGLQFKKIMDKNAQLQKIICLQNTLIKEYQEVSHSQAKLSKLQSTNIISRSLQKAATFGKHSDSLRLLELDISSREDRHLHESCQREAEELQEYIFDLEQRMARVDAEVESRVQAATHHLQQQIELRCSELHLAVIESLREELAQARDSLKKMERENRLQSEKWNRQEAKIKHREVEVCKLYEGLSQEWQIQQKAKDQGRSSRSRPKQPINYPILTSQQSREYRQPASYESLQLQFSSQNTAQPKTTRDLVSFTRKSSNQYGKYRLQSSPFGRQYVPLADRFPSSKQLLSESRERRHSFKKGTEDAHELSIINHKIQRLRSEISRELESMS